ncbi:flavin-containing monooxygenase [Streptomyces mirabilis]|uniref:flavin-containing monooxygenase n=1 Tax=Streptomyces mirabilis TaxID=68239 RepID=UPI0036BE88FB
MSVTRSDVGDVGFDPDAIRHRYEEEREKRRPASPGRPARPLAADTPVSPHDPFAVPGFERAALAGEADVVVVGGGFTGLVTGAHLRKVGVPLVRLIEKGGGFGGVWYWNRYPGIRCDVDSYVYLPMLEDVGTMPSEKYAHGEEIRQHCQELAKAFGLDEAALLQTQVTGLCWDEDTDRWTVTTDRGDEIRARFVCLGSGSLDLPTIPDVPGLESFQGGVFHSSRWDYDFTGGDSYGGLDRLRDKRVAVVGNAASAIQFIPHLAEYAGHVTVFQRTPVVVFPRDNKPTDLEWFHGQAPGWQRERTHNMTAVVQGGPGQAPSTDLVDDALTHLFKWTRELPPELDARYKDADPATRVLYANYAAMEKVRADMGALIGDPATAEVAKPYYNLGCKRPQFSDTYLQTYNRANVTLVDTRGAGIERLTPNGVVVAGVEFEADGVVFGTGFAVNAIRFPVVGREGTVLSEKWAGGVRTLHGILSAGFPNLFVVGGIPQATHTFNFTHMLDEQARHVATIVNRCLADGVTRVEVRPEAEDRWAEQIRTAPAPMPKVDLACATDSVMNVIRSGYPGGPLTYMQICRDWLTDGYERDLILERSDGGRAFGGRGN